MASQALGKVLQDCGSIALSGNASVVVAVPTETNKLVIQVACKYAAEAATTGLTAAFSYSPDGSTYTASAAPSQVLKPAVGVMGSVNVEFGISAMETRRDPGNLNYYKVTLTNADATNAVVYAVAYAAL